MAATSCPERRDEEARVRVPEVMTGREDCRHLRGAGGLPSVVHARHGREEVTAVGIVATASLIGGS
jgi:hypothetical protein